MKVLFLSSEMNNAFTPAAGVFNLARLAEMQQIGFEIKIINAIDLNFPLKNMIISRDFGRMRDTIFKLGDLLKPVNFEGMEVIYVIWAHLPRKLLWYYELQQFNLCAGHKIMKEIDAFLPDVVITSWLHPYGTYAKYIKKHHNIPVISICEGSDVLVHPRKYSGIERISKNYVQYIDELIFVSEKQKEIASEYFPSHTGTVIRNGYNKDLFLYRKQDDGNRQKTIVSVGNLSYTKGHDILLEAIKMIDDSSVRLVLAGDGEKRNEYEHFIQRNRLNDRIELKGECPQRVISELLRKCDIYCQPSRSESFGISVLEAMACGLPAVVSGAGGLPELVKNGFNGLIFSSGSITDLAEKLTLALKSDWQRENIAQYAYDCYGWDRWAARMKEVINNAILLKAR